MEGMGIDQRIGSAVYSYLQALRHLDREDVTVLQISDALKLPEAIVEQAFTEFKMGRAQFAPKNEKRAPTGPWSRVILLNPPKASMPHKRRG